MFKKISIFILCLVMTLSMFAIAGCNNETAGKDNGKINIVATIFPQYDFAREIVGDKANIDLLIPPGGESHSYEPTPKDIIAVENADVFLYIGGENDHWVDKILTSVNSDNMEIVKLIDSVETVCINSDSSHNHNDSEHSHSHSVDEHIWTSPLNAIKMVDTIRDSICKADPENKDYYVSNATKYKNSLKELDNSFKNVVKNSKRQELIFGDRFPLIYFTNEYGLSYISAFPGCSAETEPSASTLATLTSKIKEEKLPVILKIELSNSTVADTIAEETGANVMTFYSCHNLSKEQFENGESYLSMMTENINTLKTALN